MFYVTQSNDIAKLFEFLLEDYQTKNANIFEQFTVIVPAKVMGEWLKKQVADKAGISTLVVTEFWGRYQWQIMQSVLKAYSQIDRRNALRVPDVAMLSRNVMQWRMFGFFSEYQSQILADTQHPLYPLLEPLSEPLSAPLFSAMSEQNAQMGQKASDNFSQLPSLGGQNSWLYTPSFLTKPPNKPLKKPLTKPFSPTPIFTKNALDGVLDNALDSANQIALESASQQRLWQLAGDMASMLSRYMTYRPEWLADWAENRALPIEKMMVEKSEFFAKLSGNAEAEMPPDWLITHYTQLEQAQRFLWRTLFAQTYQYRQKIEEQFWNVLKSHDECRAVLPKSLTLFTIQMLPPTELKLMLRLSQYMDIKLLHYNPSALFWADIVDEKWLLSQKMLRPDTVYLKDFGHILLSRFGKQSREIFAMLADLSGNEDSPHAQVEWEDEFVQNDEPTTVLAQLQQDILMLEKDNTALKIEDVVSQIKDRKYSPNRQWRLGKQDNSLSIHGCHGMIRQLEVLRSLIIGWLNYVDDPVLAQRHQANLVIPEPYHRHVSDILILLPDLDAQQAVIETLFPAGKGADGYIIPAKVTGVLSKDINQLWSAIIGFFVLHTQPTSRFERNSVFDWLMLSAVYESYGLNQTQMARACDLLQQAGFIRGFDEIHLQQSLHESDDDYRFSFAYALERLVAGVLMPHAQMTEFGEYINQYGEREKILPLPQMQLADSDIVAALCDIFTTLDRYRSLEHHHQTAEYWLELIESFIHEKFSIFEQTTALKAIWSARNSFEKNIIANKRQTSRTLSPDTVFDTAFEPDKLSLPLGFILSSMQAELASQQVSAEPAGVITFGRLGALRNLPYKLVVMLDMNLNNFPKRDVANRYDLIQVGKGERGDRFREDDDLGAFLDAILSAKQACWLFYNRASMTQTQEQLPASPVQELMDFLQSEITWQADLAENEVTETTKNTQNPMENGYARQSILREWLITNHPMLPFHKSYFKEDKPDDASDTAISTPTETAIATEQASQQETEQTPPNNQTATDLIYQLKNAKKPLFPSAKLWYNVYKQLANHTQSADDISPSRPAIVELLGIAQLETWQQTWQLQQQQINDPQGYQRSQDESQPTDTSPEDRTIHIQLPRLISGLQKPAQLFLQAQQIHLETLAETAHYLEPLEMDGLNKFILNKFLLTEVIDSQQSPAHNAQQKMQRLPFDSQLPAGVKRYESLNSQKNTLLQAIHTLLETLDTAQPNLFPKHTHIKDLLDSVIIRGKDYNNTNHSNNNHSNNNHNNNLTGQPIGEVTTDSELLLHTVGRLITTSTAQRVAVEVVGLELGQNGTDESKSGIKKGKKTHKGKVPFLPNLFAHSQGQTVIITANLPLPKTQNPAPDLPEYWFNYLPTNGREKYLLDMWLHHLCWQVARQTTTKQVADNDGMSLWQFSGVKLVYLPPIIHSEAMAYLQDWLMVWQLAQRTVVMLPPSIGFKYAQATQIDDPIARATEEQKALAEWVKDTQGNRHSDYISDETVFHPTWQFILGENAPAEAILAGYMSTLGVRLYQPLVAKIQHLTSDKG